MMVGNQQIQNFITALETVGVAVRDTPGPSDFNQGVQVGTNASQGDVLAEIDSNDLSTISANVDATAAIDIEFRTSPDGAYYFDNVTTIDGSPDGAYQSISTLREELTTGARFVRAVLDTPAGVEATATIALEASR